MIDDQPSFRSNAEDCAGGIAVEIYSKSCAFYCGASSEGRLCPCVGTGDCRIGKTAEVREHVLTAARTAPPACCCDQCITARNRVAGRIRKGK